MNEINFNNLSEPFYENHIEWRVQQCGKSRNGKIWAMVLAYIDNRAILNRLDEVCGHQYWKNEYKTGPDGGILCGISIKCDDEWVTKWDGAENTDVEAVKGGLSNSMKRAANQWGIGRYLYDLESTFAIITEDKNGSKKGKTKDNTYFYWRPPNLPEWAKRQRDNKTEHEVNKETTPKPEPKPLTKPRTMNQKIGDIYNTLSKKMQAEIKKTQKSVGDMNNEEKEEFLQYLKELV
jgi:hypothetical protein